MQKRAIDEAHAELYKGDRDATVAELNDKKQRVVEVDKAVVEAEVEHAVEAVENEDGQDLENWEANGDDEFDEDDESDREIDTEDSEKDGFEFEGDDKPDEEETKDEDEDEDD